MENTVLAIILYVDLPTFIKIVSMLKVVVDFDIHEVRQDRASID